MSNNKVNREPFYYPDYIIETLHRLGQASSCEGYPLLNKRIDIIQILYNQFEDYPITEQVYSYVWVMLNNMINNGYNEWVKHYWSYACQYYMFTKEYADDELGKKRFQEFHIMVGAMMVYLKKYDLLNYILTYSASLPAKYPLIPSTFNQIYSWYKILSEKNQHFFYLIKYNMKGMNNGANEENIIESLLLEYIALLLIRLDTVNDYNITYSDPIEIPECENTVEKNEKNISISEVIIDNINKWSRSKDVLEEMGMSEESVEFARKLVKKYQDSCKTEIESLKTDKKRISERKRKLLEENIKDAISNIKINLPESKEIAEGEPILTQRIAEQSVKLDDRMILEGREPISNNLADALVSALYMEIRHYYCYQFLLQSATASYSIPYRDLSKAFDRLEINCDFTIIAMGVSIHLYDEIEGFSRNGSKIDYKGINVIEIASNENSFIIMKSSNIPRVRLRALNQEEKQDNLECIDSTHRLYTNINNIDINELLLKAKIGYQIHIYNPMKYIRFKIAYQLDSDDVLLNRVKSIKNIIV
jgi:hypothetical protein